MLFNNLLKQIVTRLKVVLTQLLVKVEQIEKKYNLSIKPSKIKTYKENFRISKSVIIAIFLCCLAISFFILQVSSTKFLITKESVIFQFFILLIFLAIFFISLRYFFVEVKFGYYGDIKSYQDDTILFWTVLLLGLIVIVVLRLNSIFEFWSVPVFGFTLLVSLLLNNYWGLIFSWLMSLITTIFYKATLEQFIFFVLSSLNIIRYAEQISSRKDIVIVLTKSTLINIVLALSLHLLSNFEIVLKFGSDFFRVINKVILNNLFGGIFSWLVINIFLSPLEMIYKKTTKIKLIELTNFNHPLLKRLITDAPGTYHHSIIVSTLAENVASQLGANSLLCKVGGYYHDIGKMVKPEYFIENQIGITNPHEDVNPSLSALIIISHVKEGVKLAQEYKLDPAIIDLIQQHHGNSVIHGLYEKRLHPDFNTTELARYPGPKPQTKEAAILMIADSCEAACRSIPKPNVQQIKDVVEQVINSKFVEGQFDESPLTLRDLHRIANIITQLLISFYHLRTSPLTQNKDIQELQNGS